jgi:hypothetical protein
VSVKSEIVWRLLLGHYCCVVNGGIRRDPTIGALALPRWVDVFYYFSLPCYARLSLQKVNELLTQTHTARTVRLNDAQEIASPEIFRN